MTLSHDPAGPCKTCGHTYEQHYALGPAYIAAGVSCYGSSGCSCTAFVPPSLSSSPTIASAANYVKVGRWFQCAHCGVIILTKTGGPHNYELHWCGAPWQAKATDIPAEWIPGKSPLMKPPLSSSGAVPETKEIAFLHAGDERVWCVRCNGFKSVDGESGPCPDDVPLEECPIQEGDVTKWKPPTLADAQRALDALAKEMSDIDDAGVIAANMADAEMADLCTAIHTRCGRALSGDQDKRSLVAALESVVALVAEQSRAQ